VSKVKNNIDIILNSRKEIKKELNKTLDSSSYLCSIIEPNSYDYRSMDFRLDHGVVFAVAKIDIKKLIPIDFIDNENLFLELFDEYLYENCSPARREGGKLCVDMGPSIVIEIDSKNGKIIDQNSGKTIATSKDYNNTIERNALIEQWMEKNGFYTNVFELYYSDYLKPVSTLSPLNKMLCSLDSLGIK